MPQLINPNELLQHSEQVLNVIHKVKHRKLIDPSSYISKTEEPKINDVGVLKLQQEIKNIADARDFTSSPFVQFFHAVEYEGITIDLKTALQINLYPLIVPEITYRLSTTQNMNWSVFGSPGSGKSLTGLALYEIISKLTGVSLKTRNMFTNGNLLYQRLLQLYARGEQKKDLFKNDVIFVDENVKDVTGLGAVHSLTQQTEMEIRIRKAMIHFIWVSTVLYPHQSTVVLETYDSERDKEEIWRLLRVRCLVYDHSNILKGSLIMPMPRQDVIDAYTRHIKDEGNKNFFAGEVDQRAAMLRKIAQDCLKDAEYVKLKNREQRFQYLDEHFGYMKLTIGMQARIIGLTKPTKGEGDSYV